MEKSILTLNIPELRSAPVNAFLSNPKQVAGWIDSLPMANVGETSRQVFKTLVQFNREEVPSHARLKIAELFCQPIGYISDNLRKYYFDVAFPLSAKNRKIAVLSRELYSELAISYKIFIENMIAEKSGKFDKKLLIIAIHRAIRYLSQTLYQSAIIYSSYPKHCWEEINRLYIFAESNGIHELAVKENNSKAGCTISDLFKQVTLFSILAPYSMRQREIEHIYSMLPAWSALISVEKLTESIDDSNHFISDLRTDHPPSHAKLHIPGERSHCRVINLQSLIKQLRNEFDSQTTTQDSTASKLSSDANSKYLLRKIIEILSTAPTRDFVRTRLNFDLKVAVGLNAIYSLISESQKSSLDDPIGSVDDDWQKKDDEELSNTNSSTTSGYAAEPATIDMDAQDLSLMKNSEITETINKLPSWATSENINEETIISGPVGGRGLGPSSITPSWAAPDAQSGHTMFSCKTINESAGGYCINWHGVNIPQIKVGEIVAIQSATSRNQYSIGITRWMKHGSRQNLQIGMQVTAPSSIAVMARHTGNRDFNKIAQKCLLLPELKAAGQPATLISPTLPFKAGDTLWIHDGVGEQAIRLTRLQDSSGAFSQFQFVYTQDIDSPQETQERETESNEDFDNIWSML